MAPSLGQLQRLEPIRGLSAARLDELASMCAAECHALGSDPLLQPAGMQFIYLLAGELRLLMPDGGSQVLVGGCDAANWPIGYKTVAPVRSRAITEVVLLRLDFDLLDIMMTWDELSAVAERPDVPTNWATMTGAFNAQALTSSALAKLPPAHIHELLARFERLPVRRGQRIFEEGAEGDYYYLIERGRCDVTRRIGGADVHLAELKAGNAFGEEALVSGTRRGASVIMKTDGVLLRLAKPDFVALLQQPLMRPIEQAEALQLIDQGAAVWLDVRYPAEFAENGLPEAINVPLNEIRSAFSLLPRNRCYIVYCQSGRRSSAAAFLLAQQGFDTRWLQDGLGLAEFP